MSNLIWSELIPNYYHQFPHSDCIFTIEPEGTPCLVKYIPGFPGYACSQEGDIFSSKWITWRKLKVNLSQHGYLRIGLSSTEKIRTVSVHRIVAITWIPNPSNLPEVDHIDRDRTNNQVSNLRWVTRGQNNLNRINSSKIPLEYHEEYTTIISRHNQELDEFFSRININSENHNL